MLKDKNDIVNWLEEYHIDNYELIESDAYGFVVNVGGTVALAYCQLTEIAVKFNRVSRDFYCHGNQLTSLVGAPDDIGGDFYCNDNKITSLDHCPQHIGNDFNCTSNKITSLKGCIRHIKGSFACDDNELVDLESCPIQIDGYFYAQKNNIQNLLFFPQHVGKKVYLLNNPELANWQIEKDFTILQKEHIRQKSLHDLQNKLVDNLPQQNISPHKNKI